MAARSLPACGLGRAVGHQQRLVGHAAPSNGARCSGDAADADGVEPRKVANTPVATPRSEDGGH